jgi:hypothetical protein
VLQLIDEAGIVEWFSALDWIGRAEQGGQPNFSLSDRQCQRRVRTGRSDFPQPWGTIVL